VFDGLGSHGHSRAVGGPVDSARGSVRGAEHTVGNDRGVGSDWRAPARNQHSLACSTVAGTEYTVGGVADVNLACSTGREASTRIGRSGTAGTEHRNTAGDVRFQSRPNTAGDSTDNIFAGAIQRTPTRARQDLGRTGSGALITPVSTRVLNCGHALATGVHQTAVSNTVGNTADLDCQSRNNTADDTIDSTYDIGNAWWTPTRTGHNLACSSFSGADKTHRQTWLCGR
jgi:hypothetical protein